LAAQSGRKSHPTVGTFAITHDVDYIGCYEYLPRLIEVNAELGVSATYNFLTHARYRLADNVLFLILDKGNEIGLHGKHHDRALGFRSPRYIREFIALSKKELEKTTGRIHGFRTPALAISTNIISVLEELGFKYDSSLTNCGLYSSFTQHCRPFKIGSSGLMEIPLTIQDSMFVNDIPATQAEVEQVFKHLIDLTLRCSATLVVNCHPIIIRSNPERYMRIAGLLKASSLRQSLMKDTF
jgi:peptidoglycan/xylan/chitin deacetylase (PgdA/CDA1 family)